MPQRPCSATWSFRRAPGIPRPTVARLTHTLAELGYLRYDAGSREISPWRAGLAHGPPAAGRHAISPGRAADDAGTGAERARHRVDRPARRHGDDLCRDRAIRRRRTAHPRHRHAHSRRPDRDGARRGGDPARRRVRAAGSSGCKADSAEFVVGLCATNTAPESGNARTGASAPASASTWPPSTRSRLPCFTRETSKQSFSINCGIPAFRLQPGQLEAEIGPRISSPRRKHPLARQ